MRVVVVTTSFPGNDEDPSGHFVRSSARALARAGAEVHVIAAGGSIGDAPIEAGGLVVHRAGGGALFAWPGAAARAREAPWRLLSVGPFAAGVIKRLRDVARVGPIDRAVAHWIIPCAWPLMLAGPDVPLEIRAHGADVRLLIRSPRASREAVIGTLLGRGARFVFAARALRDALTGSLRAPLARALERAAHVEPAAIDVPDTSDVAGRSSALRSALAMTPGERLVVVACRLIPSKRVGLALEATRAAGPGVRLVVLGDGPERSALERVAGAMGSASGSGGGLAARFVGALPRREALAWIAAADALLHTSAIEAAPTVIREARALGVPVIACDAGDVVAWALDDPGITVAPDTVEGVAAALRAVASRAA